MRKRNLAMLLGMSAMPFGDFGGPLQGNQKKPLVPRMWGKGNKPKRLTPAQRYHRKGKK